LSDAQKDFEKKQALFARLEKEDKKLWGGDGVPRPRSTMERMRMQAQAQRVNQQRRAEGLPYTNAQQAKEALTSAEQRLARAQSRLAELDVNNEKRNAGRAFSDAAQKVVPSEAAALRERFAKKQLSTEQNLEKERSLSTDESRSEDQRKASKEKADRIEEELGQLNEGIKQLNDQQREYVNTYVRYEKAELRQKETHKQNAQLMAEQNVGANILGIPQAAKQEATQKIRKELGKGKEQQILESFVEKKMKEDKEDEPKEEE
jgi:hypothetical protein